MTVYSWLVWSLEFNSPFNTIKVMSSQSVYLTTLLLGSLLSLRKKGEGEKGIKELEERKEKCNIEVDKKKENDSAETEGLKCPFPPLAASKATTYHYSTTLQILESRI